MRAIPLAMAAALALAGCTQSINYVMTEYGDTKVQDFVEPASGETFRIFYKPTSDKMMITQNLGRVAQTAASYGLVPRAPDQVYPNVAAAYLRSIGRDCSVTGSAEIVQNQYEVTYSCA